MLLLNVREHGEIREKRKEKRVKVSRKRKQWQHDMFGPEEVKHRVGERDGGRRRETSHVQSHSPLGCARQHTPSIMRL